jgi:hypothetical protein
VAERSPNPRGLLGAGITRAQIFANLCKDEDLPSLFCAAGNYQVVNKIAQAGIPGN